ncbi:catechol 1,2-dioxygenase [Sporosarcina sp. P2]|uniref:dioxygenase family protein n=1 Tax=Sporosarcina sp. P2 TaxID=2048251 RepID=UPI000C165021|nr:dioxygenase [Sporosarcina sp. P2]PID01068.1 catechol 1,2-dioxygenase [Sporosarcina sp. P2]
MQKEAVKKNDRVVEVFDLFIKHIQSFLEEAELNHEEYTNFVNWADRLGRTGELPLFADVFLETHVLRAMYTEMPGTQPSLLGPYFIEGTPLLKAEGGKPIVLTQRPNEAGDVLYFKGNVSNVDGEALGNVKVEMWHNDSDATYSAFDSVAPKYNLRGHFYTDENGNFEVKTILPTPYPIPTNGPTGEFLEYADKQPMRPAHLHLMFEAEGHETLITQVFPDDDKWLENDVADGVRLDLLTKFENKGDHYEAALNFVMRKEQ